MPQYQPNYLYSPRYGSRYMGNNVHAPASGPLGAQDEQAAEAKKEAAQGNQQQPQVQSPYGDNPPPQGQYDAWAAWDTSGRQDVGSLGEFGFRDFYQSGGPGYGPIPQGGGWQPPTQTTQTPDVSFDTSSSGGGGTGGYGTGTGSGYGPGSGTYGTGGIGEGSGFSSSTNLGGDVSSATANPSYGGSPYSVVVNPDGSTTMMQTSEVGNLGEGYTVVDSQYGVWTDAYGNTVQVGSDPGQYSPELATQLGFYDNRSLQEWNDQQAIIAEQERQAQLQADQNAWAEQQQLQQQEFNAAQAELDREAEMARLEYEQGAITERQLEQIEADLAAQKERLEAEAANLTSSQEHEAALQEALLAAEQAALEFEQGAITERQLNDIEANAALAQADYDAQMARLEYEQGAISERQLLAIEAEAELQQAQIDAAQAALEYEQGAIDARQLAMIEADADLAQAELDAAQARLEYEQGAISDREMAQIEADLAMQEADLAYKEFEQGQITERQLAEIEANAALQEARLAAEQAALEFEQGAITERQLNEIEAQATALEAQLLDAQAAREHELALQEATAEHEQAMLEYEQGMITDRELAQIEANLALQEAELEANRAQYEYEQGMINDRQLAEIEANAALQQAELDAELARLELEQGAITERQLNDLEAMQTLREAELAAAQAALEYEQGAITERELALAEAEAELQQARIDAEKAQYEYEQGAIDARQLAEHENQLALQEAQIEADKALAEYEQGKIDERELARLEAEAELAQQKIEADQALAEYEQGLIDERQLAEIQANYENTQALIESNEALTQAEIDAAQALSEYEQGQMDRRALEEAERTLQYQQSEYDYQQALQAYNKAQTDYEAGLINEVQYAVASFDYSTSDLTRQAELDKQQAEIDLQQAQNAHSNGDITDEELQQAQDNYDNTVATIDAQLDADQQAVIDNTPEGSKILVLADIQSTTDISSYDMDTIAGMDQSTFDEMKEINDQIEQDLFGYYTSADGTIYQDTSFLSDPTWENTTGGVNYVDTTSENFAIENFTGDQLLIDYYNEATEAAGQEGGSSPEYLDVTQVSKKEVTDMLQDTLAENQNIVNYADIPEHYFMDMTEAEIAELYQQGYTWDPSNPDSVDVIGDHMDDVRYTLATMSPDELIALQEQYNADRLLDAGLTPGQGYLTSDFLQQASSAEIDSVLAGQYEAYLSAAGFTADQIPPPHILGTMSVDDVQYLMANPELLSFEGIQYMYEEPDMVLVDGRWEWDPALGLGDNLEVEVSATQDFAGRFLNNALSLEQAGIDTTDLDYNAIMSMDKSVLDQTISYWNGAIENTKSILAAEGIDPNQFSDDYLATMSQYERQAIIDAINSGTYTSDQPTQDELLAEHFDWSEFNAENFDPNNPDKFDASQISPNTLEYLSTHPAFADVTFSRDVDGTIFVADVDETRLYQALVGYQQNFTGAPVVVDSGGTGSLVTGGTEVPFTQAERDAFGESIAGVKKFYDNAGILQYLLPGGIAVSALDYLVNGGVSMDPDSWQTTVDGVDYVGSTGDSWDPSLFTSDPWTLATNATELFDYDNPDYWTNQQQDYNLEQYGEEYYPSWDEFNPNYSYDSDPNISEHSKEVLHTLEDEFNYAIMQDEVNQLDWANPETISAMTGLDIDTSAKVLAEFISTGESSTWQKQEGATSAYDSVYGYGLYGQPDTNLTEMTLQEAYDYARSQVTATKGQIGNPDPTLGTSAIGKYQFTTPTMIDVVNNNPELFGGTWEQISADPNQKFDAEFQDNLFMGLATMEGLDDYLAGTMSREEFQNNLASRWQSIPKADGTYIGGAEYGLDLDKTIQMLEDIKAERITDVSDVTDVLDRYGVDYTLGTSEEDLMALDAQRTQTEYDFNDAVATLEKYGYTADYSQTHLATIEAAETAALQEYQDDLSEADRYGVTLSGTDHATNETYLDQIESEFNTAISHLEQYGYTYTDEEIANMHYDSVIAASQAAAVEYNSLLMDLNSKGYDINDPSLETMTVQELQTFDQQLTEAQRYGETLTTTDATVNQEQLAQMEQQFNDAAYTLESEYGITYTDTQLSQMHLDSILAAEEAARIAYESNILLFEGTKTPTNTTLATMSSTEAADLADAYFALDNYSIEYTVTSDPDTVIAAADAARDAVITNKAIYEDAGLTPPSDSELALMSTTEAQADVDSQTTTTDSGGTYTENTYYGGTYTDYSGGSSYSGYYSTDYSGTGYSAGQYADYGYDDGGYYGSSSSGSSSGGK